MRQIAVALIALLVAHQATAQQPQLREFDVVSVKPSPGVARQGPDMGRVGVVRQPGRWRALHVTVVQLIDLAYPEYANGFVVDGPGWVRDSRFTIEATMSTATPTAIDLQRMIGRMLEQRFGLVTRAEKRPLDVYALKVAREDGRLGPNLVPSAPECISARGQGQPPPAHCERFREPAQDRDNSITVHVSPVSRIVQMLTSVGRADRPIIDQTGLTGRYDIQLQYRGGFGPGAAGDDGVPLYTALEEQLGLKLERRRDVLPVLVIDAASLPQPN